MSATIPRPGRFPFHADNTTPMLPTVAEGSGYIGTTIADPAVANALGYYAGRWLQYADLHKGQIEDTADPGVPYLVRGLSLEYPVGAGLANLVPTQTPVIVGGGMRLAFDLTVLSIFGASPYTFPNHSRVWFYGSLPAGPGEYPAVRIDVVTIGDAATPLAGEVVLGGADTNGTQVIALLPSTLSDTLTVNVPTTYADTLLSTNGAGTTLRVTGGGITGGAPAAVISGGIGPAIEILCTSPSDNAVTIAASGGGAALLITQGGAQVNGTARFFNAVLVDGIAVFDTTLIALGIANLTAGATVSGTLTANDDTVLGSSAADTLTVNALLGGDLNFDTFNASNVGRLILSTGITPLNAGQLTAGSGGLLRYQPAAQAHYVHTTQRGYLFDAQTDPDILTLVGASGNLCRLTVSPAAVGRVLLEASFIYDPSVDTGTVTVFIRDDTDSINITSRLIRGIDIDGAGTRAVSVNVRVVYTLPDADPGREFVFDVQTGGGGSADIYLPTLSIQGTV